MGLRFSASHPLKRVVVDLSPFLSFSIILKPNTLSINGDHAINVTVSWGYMHIVQPTHDTRLQTLRAQIIYDRSIRGHTRGVPCCKQKIYH